MTSVYSATNAASAAQSATANSKVGTGFGGMDASDFLRLLTVQMTHQDPTAPMDNQDMLAQMAQFTSLSNATQTAAATAEMSSTLKAIAAKLGVEIDTSATTDTAADGSTENVAA